MLLQYATSKRDGSLAQLVEQWTFNPLVPRSSRGRPTTYFDTRYGSLAQLVEQWTFNPLVPRSSRGRPTRFEKAYHLFDGLFLFLFKKI